MSRRRCRSFATCLTRCITSNKCLGEINTHIAFKISSRCALNELLAIIQYLKQLRALKKVQICYNLDLTHLSSIAPKLKRTSASVNIDTLIIDVSFLKLGNRATMYMCSFFRWTRRRPAVLQTSLTWVEHSFPQATD